MKVSIHTPTQGVTISLLLCCSVFTVSIHTPTQGVTPPHIIHLLEILFQSTHPRRVWRLNHILTPPNLCFNPHTHAGCDFDQLGMQSVPALFQSTHPRRVWQRQAVLRQLANEFQSTHPRRVWQLIWRRFSLIRSFNPHTHAGCDLCHFSPLSDYVGFNPHTHAGCDWLPDVEPSTCYSFNPHTHAGCDFFSLPRYVPNPVPVSIHTPTQGVTCIQYDAQSVFFVSIHTPTQGVTPWPRWWGMKFLVSIHTPTQGVTF